MTRKPSRPSRQRAVLVFVVGAAALSLAACQTGDTTRAGLEHEDQVIAPAYNADAVVLSEAPVRGQGAPYAEVPQQRD